MKASERTDLKIHFLLSIVLVMDRSTLVQIPGEYQDIYKGSWNTIKTSIKQGRLKDVYHFCQKGLNWLYISRPPRSYKVM